MAKNDDHRITARSSKVGDAWYEKDKEWQAYSCGVTAHGDCKATIKIPTGKKK